jgi:hypothetical protein
MNKGEANDFENNIVLTRSFSKKHKQIVCVIPEMPLREARKSVEEYKTMFANKYDQDDLVVLVQMVLF